MPGVVAIAGASTGIGDAIVDALSENGITDFVILSRKPSSDKRTIAVGYKDVDNLQHVLQEHQVETVICTLSIGDDSSGQGQMNLIQAADRASCTRRFMPSEFGMHYKEEHIGHLPAYAWKLKAKDALATSNLKNRFAALPGDASTPMVLTHSRDAGRFTVALLNVPRWEARYSIIENRLSLKEAAEVVEQVLGSSLEVHYDSIDDLVEGRATLTPRLESMVKDTPMEAPLIVLASKTGLLVQKGAMDLELQNNLVDMFPHIKPLTVREVAEAWR